MAQNGNQNSFPLPIHTSVSKVSRPGIFLSAYVSHSVFLSLYLSPFSRVVLFRASKRPLYPWKFQFPSFYPWWIRQNYIRTVFFADFYKKLLATDAQIQKLKNSQTNFYSKGSDDQHPDYYPRYKRALWGLPRPFARFRHAKTLADRRGADAGKDLNGTAVSTLFPTTFDKEIKKPRTRRNVKGAGS